MIVQTLRRLLPAAAVATVAALACPGDAAASGYGYVCSTFFIPGDTTLGDEGYVNATYYSSPNCTGSYLASRTYCSPGHLSWSSACAQSDTYTYGRDSLLALVGALTNAAEWGQRIYFGDTTCESGSTHCGSIVYFYGN